MGYVVVVPPTVLKAILLDFGDTLAKEEPVWREDQPDMLTTLIEDADDILDELKKTYRLCLITNTSTSGEEDVRKALREFGIEKYFEVVVSSVDVQSKKPDSKIFLEALNKLRLKSSEVVMVGNRIDTDILGANKLGIKSIHYQWNDKYSSRLDTSYAKPDATIQCLRDLPKTIAMMDSNPSLRQRIWNNK